MELARLNCYVRDVRKSLSKTRSGIKSAPAAKSVKEEGQTRRCVSLIV